MTIRLYPLCELCAAPFFVYFVFRLFLYHKAHKVCHEPACRQTGNTKLETRLIYADSRFKK